MTTYAQNGWRYDTKVTATMVEDMQFNPILACKVLLGFEVVLPHQELRILQMWTRHMTLDDSGFSTGKSITQAMVSALRCMLFPHRTVGIISGTFRQGKLIFNYFDQWANASKIFRSSLKKHNGQPRLTHDASLWQAKFTGDSEIRVLPPNIVQDAVQLRSERWNDAHIDEWTIFGNFAVITKTIFGRVTKVNDYQTCPVRQNHIHLCSTPEYEHSPSFSIVKEIDKQVKRDKKRNYARFTSNWRHVPRTKRYAKYVDRRTIYTMQTINPPGVVKSEIDGLWQSDSQSFYLSNEVEVCRDPALLPHLDRINKDDTFIGAFDTARGASKAKRGATDDFSFSGFRIPKGSDRPIHAFTVRKNGINAAGMAAIIHGLHKKLAFSLLMFDPGGGGLFVADELEKSEHNIGGEGLVPCFPIIKTEDTPNIIGDKILIPFQRRCTHIDSLWGSMASDSILVNRMHTHFTEGIRNNKISLAPEYDWTKTQVRGKDVGAMRDYLNAMAPKMSPMERAKAEMDLAVSQLILVDVARTPDGSPMIDTYGMFKFKSKEKKDSAYSLCYCWVLWMIWSKLNSKAKKIKKKSFAASIQEIGQQGF